MLEVLPFLGRWGGSRPREAAPSLGRGGAALAGGPQLAGGRVRRGWVPGSGRVAVRAGAGDQGDEQAADTGQGFVADRSQVSGEGRGVSVLAGPQGQLQKRAVAQVGAA